MINFEDIRKPFYIAAVLTENSSNVLKTRIPPIHSDSYYHHMTMCFKPDEKVYQKYADLVHKSIELKAEAVFYDKKGQALFLDTKFSENSYPHITLSCADGVKPFYSNTIFENPKQYKLVDNLTLDAVVTIVEM
jgi:hypothetical protein